MSLRRFADLGFAENNKNLIFCGFFFCRLLRFVFVVVVVNADMVKFYQTCDPGEFFLQIYFARFRLWCSSLVCLVEWYVEVH